MIRGGVPRFYASLRGPSNWIDRRLNLLRRAALRKVRVFALNASAAPTLSHVATTQVIRLGRRDRQRRFDRYPGS